MSRVLIVLCVLLVSMSADARDPRGKLDRKNYGSARAQYDDWLYVPIIGVKGQVAAAQIMSRSITQAPDCEVDAVDPDSHEPVPACYPHMSVWCEGGQTTLLMLAPESGGRFVLGKTGPVHWNLDKYIKGRWLNLHQLEDLSRMGQWAESSGEPNLDKMKDARNLSIEHWLSGSGKAYYKYSLRGFADALKKCRRATQDTSRVYDVLDFWE
ncbi:MAG: hypothetical protein K0U66_10460 [Gammaproteobacteria bacterium]|nr:hypothetical protein [Gammaproteobacteria bacterium]